MPKGIYKRPSIEEQLWSKVNRSGGPDACWPFIKTPSSNGYGTMSHRGKSFRCHRVAYRLKKGKIPKGIDVLHKCDNRLCCNPKHLFLGTDQDNVNDMYCKGRNADRKGEKHPNAKLTAKKIRIARELNKQGQTIRYIASLFNVHEATMREAIQGLTWRHVK